MLFQSTLRHHNTASDHNPLRSPLTKLRPVPTGRESPDGSIDSGDESPRLSEDSDDDEDAGI